MNLANGPHEFCTDAFTRHGIGTRFPFIQDGTQPRFVAVRVGAIDFGHHLIAFGSLVVVGRKVWMDALGNLPIESPKVV